MQRPATPFQSSTAKLPLNFNGRCLAPALEHMLAPTAFSTSADNEISCLDILRSILSRRMLLVRFHNITVAYAEVQTCYLAGEHNGVAMRMVAFVDGCAYGRLVALFDIRD
jgi:hypothetical protein